MRHNDHWQSTHRLVVKMRACQVARSATVVGFQDRSQTLRSLCVARRIRGEQLQKYSEKSACPWSYGRSRKILAENTTNVCIQDRLGVVGEDKLRTTPVRPAICIYMYGRSLNASRLWASVSIVSCSQPPPNLTQLQVPTTLHHTAKPSAVPG